MSQLRPGYDFIEGVVTIRERRGQNCVEISCGGATNRYFLFGGRDESSYMLIQGITLAGVMMDEVALMPRSFVEQALARCSVEEHKAKLTVAAQALTGARAYARTKRVLQSGAGSGILSETGKARGNDVWYVGRIDPEKLNGAFGKLHTDEVVLTGEREEHIREQHASDLALFEKYAKPTIEEPDEIIEDGKNEGTAFYIRRLPETNLNVVIRLALESESGIRKNSIITAYRIRARNLKKLENKNKVLYKRE